MRLIDADALIKWIEGECKSPSCPRSEAAFGKRILMRIQLTQTIEPEIISCKDCKFYREYGCQRAFVYPEPEDFCSRAERRKEGE